MRCAAFAVADHEHVGMHRGEVGDGVRMVSPLLVLDRATSRLTTSADRRLAAISKVVRVRVEFSKKMLKIDLPRNSGTTLTSRSLMPTKLSAVSRIAR